MRKCPCNPEKIYEQCCGPYHKDYNAPTALALMKSRYSAFAFGDIDYIDETMREEAKAGFNPEETAAWAKSVTWIGLDVINSYPDDQLNTQAYVEFVAKFISKNSLQFIHELSTFKFIDNQWYYVSGFKPAESDYGNPIKITRNEPCPCNSHKKYKNCHGR